MRTLLATPRWSLVYFDDYGMLFVRSDGPDGARAAERSYRFVDPSRRGIYVSNCPGKNSIAVAELAFGLILALDRRLADNVASLRAGQWNKKEYSKAKGIYGRRWAWWGWGRSAAR